jgi:hypothetical protein
MKEAILKELAKEDYNLRSDYLELILQYGYVTMFAVVFPIAPALAYLNNLMEAKVDFLKLANCRRPPLQDRSVCLALPRPPSSSQQVNDRSLVYLPLGAQLCCGLKQLLPPLHRLFQSQRCSSSKTSIHSGF